MDYNEAVKTFLHLDCGDKIEKKNNLSYLSWPYAVEKVLKEEVDESYKIWKDDNNRPYIYDEHLGYMVFTSVTIENVTKEMWLPVMDGANKAMKTGSYTYTTRFGEKTCEAATMFDINKTIMRCLVKNYAMFGLGLYIYAGEDLPEESDEQKAEKEAVALKAKQDAEAVALKAKQDAEAAKKKADDDLAARKAASKKCEDDLKSCKTWKEFEEQWNKLTPKQQKYFDALKETLKLELINK